jgi:glycine/D-amino acid oxidase-like deaminating enzyme
MSESPIVICGQGLAGTLLAWELVQRGRRVLIFDEADAVSSSKVAAGIVTPITGQRLTLSPGIGQFLPEALACYAAIARELGQTHFHPAPQVRLWRNPEEPARFAQKQRDPAFAAQTTPGWTGPLVDPTLYHGSGAGFEMPASGWLDVRAWLAASASWFAARGMLRPGKPDPAAFRPEANQVRLPDGAGTGTVVFCEGAAARQNPWFPWLQWKCAKGEILSVSIPALAQESRILNCGIWLLPLGSGQFRIGATYRWTWPDERPTLEGRAELESRLRGLLRVPWEITAHEAAVRPILHQSLARIGRHPMHPGLAFFNGLGSKGVLHGPRYARLLAGHLLDGTALPHHVDIAGN